MILPRVNICVISRLYLTCASPPHNDAFHSFVAHPARFTQFRASGSSNSIYPVLQETRTHPTPKKPCGFDRGRSKATPVCRLSLACNRVEICHSETAFARTSEWQARRDPHSHGLVRGGGRGRYRQVGRPPAARCRHQCHRRTRQHAAHRSVAHRSAQGGCWVLVLFMAGWAGGVDLSGVRFDVIADGGIRGSCGDVRSCWRCC